MISLDPHFTSDPLRSRYPFGRKTQLRRRYDWDAQMYFNRIQAAGTELSVEERSNISSFIRGLKKLGTWEALIEGWTMTSAQNVGTGTILPGLKSRLGTLINGPTWGPTGLSFAGNAKGVAATGSGLPVAPASLLAVGSIDWSGLFTDVVHLGNPGAPQRTFAILSAVGASDRSLSSVAVGANLCNYTPDNTIPTGPLGVWQFHQQTATTAKANINGVEIATTPFTNWDSTGIGTTLYPVNKVGPGTLVLSFIGFFGMDTQPISAQLRTLVKETIGKGLNLP